MSLAGKRPCKNIYKRSRWVRAHREARWRLQHLAQRWKSSYTGQHIQVEPTARSRIRDGRVKNGLAAAKLKWTHIASQILPDDAWIWARKDEGHSKPLISICSASSNLCRSKHKQGSQQLSVIHRLTFGRNNETATFGRATVYCLDDINQLKVWHAWVELWYYRVCYEPLACYP